jgi:hypothetical protein
MQSFKEPEFPTWLFLFSFTNCNESQQCSSNDDENSFCGNVVWDHLLVEELPADIQEDIVNLVYFVMLETERKAIMMAVLNQLCIKSWLLRYITAHCIIRCCINRSTINLIKYLRGTVNVKVGMKITQSAMKIMYFLFMFRTRLLCCY